VACKSFDRLRTNGKNHSFRGELFGRLRKGLSNRRGGRFKRVA
jgi:hypothetical protein